MPETLLALIPFREGVGQADSMSAMFTWCFCANDWLTSCFLWRVPPTQRPSTIPLPPWPLKTIPEALEFPIATTTVGAAMPRPKRPGFQGAWPLPSPKAYRTDPGRG